MGDRAMHMAGANPTGNRLAASYGLFMAVKEEATKHNMDVETALQILADTGHKFADIEQGAGSLNPHLLSNTPMEQIANSSQALQQGNRNSKPGKGKPKGIPGATRSVPFTKEQQDNICKLVVAARERIAKGQNSGVGYKGDDGYNEVAEKYGTHRARIKNVCEKLGYAYQTKSRTGPEMTADSAPPSVAPSTAPPAAPLPETLSQTQMQGTEQSISGDHQGAQLLLNLHAGGMPSKASS